MKLVKPGANSAFQVSSAAEWPRIEFASDATGPHVWTWSIKWGTFSKSGIANTPGNVWDAGDACSGFGGVLTVNVQAGQNSASLSVRITGANPAAADVDAYLRTKANSDGFAAIIAHESQYKHFNATGEPIRSFDNGYGMCQLTTPPPTFEQVWNWKRNVDAGLALFSQKRAAALAYLAQNNRSYTATQLKYESVCRWNGGVYHEWDGKAWVRTSNMLCDSKTGNIGWDMSLADNKGKTEAELHTRDSGSYSAPPGANAKWRYSGVCYADSLLK